MATPEKVLAFWLDEIGEQGWYAADESLDQKIRDKFYDAWQGAKEGALSLWMTYPSGCLAYLILTDQFSRNMFRGSHEAFSTDPAALAVAKASIAKGWDLKIDGPARQFFYLPLMHSENAVDQDRCVRLIKTRMAGDGASNLLHARAHREVIRQFGRFPFRNSALSRRDSGAELAFKENGGYGATVRQLQAQAS